jgi:hypothetical protein
MAHFEICPYCHEHVDEWKKSFDHASDTLGAIERGVARGIVEGAKGLAGKIVPSARSAKRDPAGDGDASAAETPPASPPPPPMPTAPEWTPTYIVSHDLPAPAATPAASQVPPPAPKAPPAPYTPPPASSTPPPASHDAASAPPTPRPTYVAKTVSSPSGSMSELGPTPSHASGPHAVPSPTGGLLVVECVPDRTPPDSVFLCAGALGLEVACVDRIEELEDDPDLADVQAIIIASDRDVTDWPQVLRKARKLVPGRPVLVFAMFGQEPEKGARRALGEALLSASVSPEELLLALDRRLR